uniref:Helicase ATP-binding domain-containing protein n=1 Tax=Haemonchus contortus TaxID=6289 RepID=A0A7I4XRU7_HAECO
MITVLRILGQLWRQNSVIAVKVLQRVTVAAKFKVSFSNFVTVRNSRIFFTYFLNFLNFDLWTTLQLSFCNKRIDKVPLIVGEPRNCTFRYQLWIGINRFCHLSYPRKWVTISPKDAIKLHSMICARRNFLKKLYSSENVIKSYLHSSFPVGSIGRYAKLQKRKDPLASCPPEFRAKLKEWPKLLQAEIDESVSHLKELREVSDLPALEDRGLLLGNLRLVSDDLHPITGRTVVLRRIPSLNGPDRSKIFRTGAPVTIRDAKTLREIAECVMLASNKKEIKIKIRPSSGSRHLDGDTEYMLTMSQSSGAMHSVQDFFLQNKVVDTPGVDLLGYAFRAKNMPSIHNDRMIADLSDELNESQRRAVSAALNKKRPFVTIQGPPGTGKTRVVAEIVRQLIRRRMKTLVCAPSNVATDKVMSEVIRLLDSEQLENIDPDDLMHDMVSDAETIEEAITSNDKYPELCDMFDKMNGPIDEQDRGNMKKEANKLKWKIIKESYKRRLAIFCTLTSSAIQRLAQVNWHPDVIIIDEAAQASEPVAWAAVVQAKRCILAGDHAQLPSTILSLDARKGNLDVSLMERLAKEFSNTNINQLLTIQYRMNEKIMQWSSTEFYESRLVAAEEVSQITLSDISFIPNDSPLNVPLLMINTDLVKDDGNHSFRELSSQMSFKNPGEATLVIRYVDVLKSVGISGKEIAVISPYYAQVAAIRSIINATDVSVNTVDSFQGQEREVVVFSMVRHNPEQVIGFLQNERRLNVAITRAKRQFVLIGSARMMKKNRHLRSLLSTIRRCGKVYEPGIMDAFEKVTSSLPTSSDKKVAVQS